MALSPPRPLPSAANPPSLPTASSAFPVSVRFQLLRFPRAAFAFPRALPSLPPPASPSAAALPPPSPSRSRPCPLRVWCWTRTLHVAPPAEKEEQEEEEQEEEQEEDEEEEEGTCTGMYGRAT